MGLVLLIVIIPRGRDMEHSSTAGKPNLKRSWIEVVGAYGLIEAALWQRQHILLWSITALAWISIMTIAAAPSLRQLGLSGKGLRRSIWIAFAGLILALLIVLAGDLAGSLHIFTSQPRPPLHALLYGFWALGQQFLLQSFFLLRFERILGCGREAVWATALLFFLAHLPNPVLLAVTAVAAPISIELFRRYRNIYSLAIAHALVGLALAIALPDGFTHQMKVGLSYLGW